MAKTTGDWKKEKCNAEGGLGNNAETKNTSKVLIVQEPIFLSGGTWGLANTTDEKVKRLSLDQTEQCRAWGGGTDCALPRKKRQKSAFTMYMSRLEQLGEESADMALSA